MAFILSRSAKLFVSTAKTTAAANNGNTWEIPVLDGFSFSQGVQTAEVQVSEAGTAPARGQQIFNTALDPVNWSFANYMRPRWDATMLADAVERVMWEAHATGTTAAAGTPIQTDASGASTILGQAMSVDYSDSNSNTLLPLSLFFKLGTDWYWIEEALVDTAEMDFSIESIATVTWSGFGTSLKRVSITQELDDLNAMALPANGVVYGTVATDAPGHLKAPTENACIRNKLTSMELVDTGRAGEIYVVPITGGSLTIANNITFLTPEALGTINKPCAGFTGSRTVNGNITAYLRTGALETGGLYEKLQGDLGSGSDPEDFVMTLHIGNGTTATEADWPKVIVTLPHAHLVVPVINVEDVISVDIAFSGLPYGGVDSTWDLGSTNEVTIDYQPSKII